MSVSSTYSPSEITTILEISDSTLRKWALALEEQEYFFTRTDNNKRIFADKDVIVLKHFRNLVQVQKMSLQNAAVIVASKFKEDAVTAPAQTNSENDLRSLKGVPAVILDELEQLKTFNKQLLARLDEHQKYIDERINARDALLLESIREIQKSNKLLLEQKQEEAPKKRTGLLRFFSKN